ncbi:MAG: hypothetical protein ACXVCY_10820 [Pseudobdellovibrionaceae bacterium]
MKLNFMHYFHESPSSKFSYFHKTYNNSKHKTQVWNAFEESKLIGINNDDCAILPRVLPLSYLKTIEKTAKDVTLFALRLISLPEKEIEAIIPSGPIRDFLIKELKVLKHRPQRLVGSFRFDMAVVGSPTKNNPPKLLEINEIGFGGFARSAYIQDTLLKLIPELNKKFLVLDATKADIRNMQRLGNHISRFHYDAYDWEEEVLVKKAQELGAQIDLISPGQLNYDVNNKKFPLLHKKNLRFKNDRLYFGKDNKPDALQMGYSFELEDYLMNPSMYQAIVRSKTPHYSPFVTGLVASKMILVLFNDLNLRRKLLGSSETLQDTILPAFSLNDDKDGTRKKYYDYVIKHVDGLGGKKVFVGKELLKNLKKIKPSQESEWVVQKKILLNTISVNGILSRPKKVLSDLGVFVQYDWSHGKLHHFEVGGFITRATNHSYKVNVSEGGIQVPVMFQKD